MQKNKLTISAQNRTKLELKFKTEIEIVRMGDASKSHQTGIEISAMVDL